MVRGSGRYHCITGLYAKYTLVNLFDLRCESGIFNSYTMGMSGLTDIHTQSLRAAGPRAEGVYIRRTVNAHGITTT